MLMMDLMKARVQIYLLHAPREVFFPRSGSGRTAAVQVRSMPHTGPAINAEKTWLLGRRRRIKVYLSAWLDCVCALCLASSTRFWSRVMTLESCTVEGCCSFTLAEASTFWSRISLLSAFSLSQAGSPEEAVFIFMMPGPVQICRDDPRDRMPGKRPIMGAKASTVSNIEQSSNARAITVLSWLRAIFIFFCSCLVSRCAIAVVWKSLSLSLFAQSCDFSLFKRARLGPSRVWIWVCCGSLGGRYVTVTVTDRIGLLHYSVILSQSTLDCERRFLLLVKLKKI